MPFSALIFDMDSTLADTNAIWDRAEDCMFAAIGHRRTPELAAQYAGMKADDLAATVHRILQPELVVRECQRILREALLESFARFRAPEVPGAVAMVQRLYGRVPMAVASGSPMAGIKATMAHLGITGCFDLLLSSEDLERGKPAPDVFLLAAEKLGVAPGSCLVFEDSTVGARAARAAGMRAIVRPNPQCRDVAGLAWRTVESWDEVSVESVFGDRR